VGISADVLELAPPMLHEKGAVFSTWPDGKIVTASCFRVLVRNEHGEGFELQVYAGTAIAVLFHTKVRIVGQNFGEPRLPLTGSLL